jgi:hypothetical protein
MSVGEGHCRFGCERLGGQFSTLKLLKELKLHGREVSDVDISVIQLA